MCVKGCVTVPSAVKAASCITLSAAVACLVVASLVLGGVIATPKDDSLFKTLAILRILVAIFSITFSLILFTTVRASPVRPEGIAPWVAFTAFDCFLVLLSLVIAAVYKSVLASLLIAAYLALYLSCWAIVIRYFHVITSKP